MAQKGISEKNRNIAEYLDLVDRCTATVERQNKQLWIALLLTLVFWFATIIYAFWPFSTEQKFTIGETEKTKDIFIHQTTGDK